VSNNTVVGFDKPEEVKNMLTEMLRERAMSLLSQVLSVEVDAFIEEYRDIHLSDGRKRVVRNGYHRTRSIQSGIGEVR